MIKVDTEASHIESNAGDTLDGMKSVLTRLVLLAIVAVTSFSIQGSSEATSKRRRPIVHHDPRVLLIGNSLTDTNDLSGMLCRLAEIAGRRMSCDAVTISGAGFPDHWADGRAARRIAERGWTVVSLQQGPSGSEGRPSLLEYSQRYARLIKAAGAQPALYMVWPSQQRFSDFELVSESYRMASEQSGALLIPVGDAWRAAWRKDPTIGLYGGDGFHPSVAATYLAALVFYHKLLGEIPESFATPAVASQASRQPVGVSESQLRILREAAIEVCNQ